MAKMGSIKRREIIEQMNDCKVSRSNRLALSNRSNNHQELFTQQIERSLDVKGESRLCSYHTQIKVRHL
jgi:hypothetical protein